MATASKTWTFTSDLQSWVATSVGTGNSCVRSSTNGHNDAGCINNGTTGRNHSGTGHFDLTGTWEALFGIASGSTVTAIMVSGDGYWGRCATFTTGAASTDGPLELRDSGGTLLLTLVSGTAYSGTFAYANRTPSGAQQNQAIPSAQQASGTTVAIRINGSVTTGNSSSASNQLFQDDITVTITYTPPVNPISATISGSSTVAGGLKGSGALLSAITGGTSLSAALKGAGSLVSTISGHTTVTGTLYELIAASIRGGTAISANLTGSSISNITATISGGTSLTALLAGKGVLTSSISGHTGITAALKGTGSLVSGISGGSDLVLVLKGTGELQSSIQGASSLLAPLKGSGVLVSSLSGNTNILAGLGTFSSGAIAALVSGQTSISATLKNIGLYPIPMSPDVNTKMSLFYTGDLNSTPVPRATLYCLDCGSNIPLLVRADFALWCQTCGAFVPKQNTTMNLSTVRGYKGVF